MTRSAIVPPLFATLLLSTFLVGCDPRGDTGRRTALESEALERELDLALQGGSLPSQQEPISASEHAADPAVGDRLPRAESSVEPQPEPEPEAEPTSVPDSVGAEPERQARAEAPGPSPDAEAPYQPRNNAEDRLSAAGGTSAERVEAREVRASSSSSRPSAWETNAAEGGAPKGRRADGGARRAVSSGTSAVTRVSDSRAPWPTAAETRRAAASEPRPRATRPASRARPIYTPLSERDARQFAVRVPAGTMLALRLDQEIRIRTDVGSSPVTATLERAVYDAGGVMLIPAGAVVLGELAEPGRASGHGRDAASLVEFRSLSFDGRTYPLDATMLDLEAQRVRRDSRTEQAAKIAGGAAVGGVVGRVLGRSRNAAVAGAAIGAAAGTAVVLSTARVEEVVPAGAPLTLRLDAPLEIRR